MGKQLQMQRGVVTGVPCTPPVAPSAQEPVVGHTAHQVKSQPSKPHKSTSNPAAAYSMGPLVVEALPTGDGEVTKFLMQDLSNERPSKLHDLDKNVIGVVGAL